LKQKYVIFKCAANQQNNSYFMYELKIIKKLSLANIIALIYASFGFLSSLVFSLYSLIKFAADKNIEKTFFAWLFTNIGLEILFSLLAAAVAGIFGWLAGWLAAFLYNFYAHHIGGIKIKLKEEVANSENKAQNNNSELFKW